MYQDHIQEDKEIAQNHTQVIIFLPVHYCSRSAWTYCKSSREWVSLSPYMPFVEEDQSLQH